MHGPKSTLPLCLAALVLFLFAGTWRASLSHSFGEGFTSIPPPKTGGKELGIPPFDDNSVRLYVGVVCPLIE